MQQLKRAFVFYKKHTCYSSVNTDHTSNHSQEFYTFINSKAKHWLNINHKEIYLFIKNIKRDACVKKVAEEYPEFNHAATETFLHCFQFNNSQINSV